MSAAMVPHWTGLNTIGICAEAAGVLALVVLVPWLWERARKPRQQPTATARASVAIRPRDVQPFDSPAYSAGPSTAGENPR